MLILDEPAANLDPVMRRQFLTEVLDLVGTDGRTVLFSSHELNDLERIADRIALVHEGRLLLDRETDELKSRVRRLRLIFPAPAPDNLIVPGLLRLRRAGHELLATVDDFHDELPAALARETGALVTVQPLGIEELFLDLVDQDTAPAWTAA